jgi:hypothetical protein
MLTQMTRRIVFGLLPVLLAAFLLAAVAAPRAGAASHVDYGLTDDAWLLNGPGTVQDRVSELNTIGVHIVRFSLRWDQIAKTKPATATDPADPAYDWTADDTVLDALHSAGIDVLLQLVGAPSWANGGKPSNYAPVSASTFKSFVTAAATKYSWVSRWLVWNEPNQVRWLRPTSPAVYTSRLLNPAYAAIHAAIPRAKVAGGGTAPRGSTGGVSPVTWLLGMRKAHAKLDAYAHNPYPLDPKRESPLKGGCTHCSTITMATINKLVGLVSRNFPRARIWLTEYAYQSNPPDKLLGVSPALQARYIGEGAYAAYKTPRVDLLIHFLYRDEPNLARFQSGLVTLRNAKKPAYSAFQLPLAEIARRGATVTLWGQVRVSESSEATLERKLGKAWVKVASLSASPAGYVRWTGALPAKSVVRIRSGTVSGAPLSLT